MMFREKQSSAPGGMGGSSGSGRSRLPVNHFVCNFEGCGATIKHRRNLVRHWQLHQKAKYFCARCGQLFPSRELITQHDCDRSEQRFHCDQCEKRFSALQHLNRHLLLMHGQRLFVWCPTCRSYFARIDALKKHQSRCHSLSTNSAVSGLANLASSVSGNHVLIGSSATTIAGFDLGGRGFAELSGPAAAAAAAAAIGQNNNNAGNNGNSVGSSSASIANVTNALGQSVITSTGIGGHGSGLLHNNVPISSVVTSGNSGNALNAGNNVMDVNNRSRAAAAAAAAGNFTLGSNELLNMVKNVDSVRNALMGAAGAPTFNNPTASMMSDYSQNNLFGNLITDRKLGSGKQNAMFSFATMDPNDPNGTNRTATNSSGGPASATSGNSNAGFCASNLLLSNYNKLNDNPNARSKKTKMDLVGALFN